MSRNSGFGCLLTLIASPFIILDNLAKQKRVNKVQAARLAHQLQATENARLKAQQEALKIEKESNAVVLQDLKIEREKMEIIKLQRELGVDSEGRTFAPPSDWDV